MSSTIKKPATSDVKGFKDNVKVQKNELAEENNLDSLAISLSLDEEIAKAESSFANDDIIRSEKEEILSSKLACCKIDVEEELNPPEIAWEISNLKYDGYNILGTRGNFSLITGKAKSKKSFFINIAVSAAISEGVVLKRFKSAPSSDKNDVLYFDTEQSKYHVQLALKRICTQIDISNPENLHVYGLRSLKPEDRLKLIEFSIQRNPKVGFVVIDGIKDLVTSINDEEQATMISSKLLKWTEELNIHIVTVLHQNKSDNNARGHIGTELINKAETVLSVSISEKDSEISIVEPTMCRNREPESFAFSINEEGIPKLVDDFEIKIERAKTPKTLQVLKIPNFKKFQLLTEVYSYKQNEFLYNELVEQIKVAIHNQFNETVGITKIKTLITEMKNKNWLTQEKEKGPYKLGQYS